MATLERLGVTAIRETITSYRDAVRAHAQGLNRLNVYPVPDGDTGTNMARTLDAVVAEMEVAPADLAATCRAIAHGSLMGARGNSGVILSQILRGLSNAFEKAGDVDPDVVAAALTSAANAAYQAVLRPVEGTILTVVREAAAAASRAAQLGGTMVEVLGAAQQRAQQALEHTPDLLPVLKAAGVVDAGGAGFVLLLDAALHVVDGRPVPEPAEGDGPLGEGSAPVFPGVHGVHDVHPASDPRYEVMFFLDLPDERLDGFKESWGRIGDSIVVVGGDGLWNCHVHTDDVGAAIEAALEPGGRPWKIRITDLFEEVAEEHAAREASGAEVATPAEGPEAATVTCGVVAVSTGDGLHDLFRRLGVQGVVTGGQTMNPSTAELLAAVERIPADQVVLLPNNANIVPVAEQVDALTAKAVSVVPTRSIPEALAALVAYDPDLDAPTNASRMAAATAGVAAGEVTRAVRAAAGPAGPIAEGDWIGLVQGAGIVAVAETLLAAAVGLLDVLVMAEHELVTIIDGADAPPGATETLRTWLHEQRPGVTVETHVGGQPLYPFFFGAE